MGTRGYLAYRYKNRYYRLYNPRDSYPSDMGDNYAQEIPADAAMREAWIEQLIKDLEATAQYIEYGGSDPEDEEYESHNSDAMVYHEHELLDDGAWITGDFTVDWTYVIDLDYRAFSVNGQIHFNLDNMPPWISEYIGDDGAVQQIPEEYLTTVLQWPNPDFDMEAALKSYDMLQPLVTALGEWGAPTWDTLSVAQHLSVELVKTIVSDHKNTLSTPDIVTEHHKIALHCWQIACAAAPSHLLCPPENTEISGTPLYVHSTNPWGDKQPVPYFVDGQHFADVYCWFRGCLVKICTRLDEDLYVQHEVNVMVKKLRSHGRTIGIGIILSSFQVVVVAVDDEEVRHSPVLDVHDAFDEVHDGLLLLMHLLSPAFTIQKTPWKNAPPMQVTSIQSILPEEIVRHIVHMTDDHTRHFILPLVSHGVRSICLDHPRVGNHVLIGVSHEKTFKTLWTTSSAIIETYATLVRTSERTICDRLLCTFQHHQTGQGKLALTDGSVKKKLDKMGCWGDGRDRMGWDLVIKADMPEMRIQVVEGMWSMIELGTEDLGEV